MELALAAAQQGGVTLAGLTASLRSGFYGAVLEGFPPGSSGAKQLGGVYRVCGEHAELPRFQGAEAHNGAAHMYRYWPGAGDSSWFVNTEFAPEENQCNAQVLPLPGGAVPEHGRAGVQWRASSCFLDLTQTGGKHYSVPDQPLVLTALVRSPPLAHPSALCPPCTPPHSLTLDAVCPPPPPPPPPPHRPKP
eukprot:COSAG01_NODE_22922_length_835_cov_13.822011_1_plen_192_part_00